MTMTEVGTPVGAQLRERLEALFRAFNEHDADKIISMHTPDAIWMDPQLTGPVMGRAAIAVRLAMMFRAFPDLQFLLDEMELYQGESGRVAARWHFVATMTGPIDPPGFAPTGKKASVSGVCVYEFKDELIARHEIVYDTMGLLSQVGIMPAMSGRQAKLMAGLQRAGAGMAKRTRRH